MTKMISISKFKILLYVLAIFLFPVQLLFSQTDTLENKSQTVKENKGYFKNERFSINAGYFIAGNNTGITLGSKQIGLGVVIDIEDALGLSTSSYVFRGTANYNYGKRKQHSLVVDYFSINRRATKTLEADFEYDDITYPVGTKLDSKYYFSIIRTKYEYSFLQDDRISLGFSAGLFIMPLSFSIKSDNSDEQSSSMIAPLPLVGLRSDFLITKKLILKQSAELLYLQFSDFKGSILDLNFALEHKTFKHFGFGLGINSNRLALSAVENVYPGIDFTGAMKMDYTGMFLFVSFYL